VSCLNVHDRLTRAPVCVVFISPTRLRERAEFSISSGCKGSSINGFDPFFRFYDPPLPPSILAEKPFLAEKAFLAKNTFLT
jgi:hypothetical protein